MKKYILSTLAAAVFSFLPTCLPSQVFDNFPDIVTDPFDDSCCCPDWIDVAYVAPKVCFEALRIHNDPHRFVLPGYREGHQSSGCVFGLDFGYAWKGCGGLFFQLNTSYTGGILEHSHEIKRYTYNLEVDGIIGYQMKTSFITVVPYAGVGYGYRTQKNKKHHDYFIKMRYHTLYIPIGILISARLSHCWEIAFNFKATPQADSTVKVPEISNSRFELSQMTGYLYELPITWNTMYDFYCWKVIFTPYCSTTSYGKSSWEKGFFIPQHTYMDVGLKIAAGTVF